MPFWNSSFSNILFTVPSRSIAFNRKCLCATPEQISQLTILKNKAFTKRDSLVHASKRASYEGNFELSNELFQLANDALVEAEYYNSRREIKIFTSNNCHREANTIDLHGLTVRSALDFLKERILRDVRSNQRKLFVIVGRGLNSKDYVPKLRRPVEHLLKSIGVKLAADKKNSGVYVVDYGESNIQLKWENPRPLVSCRQKYLLWAAKWLVALICCYFSACQAILLYKKLNACYY